MERQERMAILTFSQQADEACGNEFLGAAGERMDRVTPQQVGDEEGQGLPQWKRPPLETVQRLIDWFSKDIRNDGNIVS
jgi:hypothetical protein